MQHSDIESLTTMAQDKGVSISHLVRGWITERLHADDAGGVSDALEDFEQSYAALRRAISTSRNTNAHVSGERRG